MGAPGRAETGVRSAELIGGELRFVLENNLGAVAGGRKALVSFCEHHALEAAARNRLEVSFEELVSNTVRHGFRPGSGQSLRLLARAIPGQIELTLEDDGQPFDPLAQARPGAFSTLEEARLGGLGIPLVLRMSSRVRYKALAPAPEAESFRPINRLIVTTARA